MALPSPHDCLASVAAHTPATLLVACERVALMGVVNNVAHELNDIRAWHHARGFHGGVVLREIHVPLFDATKRRTAGKTPRPFSNSDSEGNAVTAPPEEHDSRQCYYLYYEVGSAVGRAHAARLVLFVPLPFANPS